MGSIVQRRKVGVIGSGSWGTAIVKILSEQDDIEINWWVRTDMAVDHITRFKHNPEYLSDVEVNLDKVTPTNNIEECIDKSDIVFLVIPAAFLHSEIRGLSRVLFKGKIIVSAVKGMVPKRNILYTDYVHKKFKVPKKDLVVVGGPCHAEEVAMEKRSYLTIGANDVKTGGQVANILKCRYVNTNVVLDILGVEYSAIIKNIVAIACGIAHGLNYGDNYQAVLVSNAMMEIKKFVQKLEHRDRNFVQTAYLGDILVTSYSQFSRNRTFGNMIGRGYSVRSAQLEMNMIAEGYYATKGVFEINQELNVDMPVLSSVYNVLYQKISPRLEFQLLSENLV